MSDARDWATVAAMFVLLGLIGNNAGEEAAGQEKAAPGPLVAVLEEFDGVHPNGRWEIHQYPGTFEYHVTPDALRMVDQRNANQHLTRRGLQLDPSRPYAIEAKFTIHERTAAQAPNSFCLNFQVAGSEGALGSLYCWSMNVDVAAGGKPGGVMRYMGFVDGRFRQIGQREVPWAKIGVEYRLRVDVNRDTQDRFKPKTITVTVTEGKKQRERFEVDYSSFPYQPDLTGPVRIGVNTHGADWTMRDLKVFAERESIVR